MTRSLPRLPAPSSLSIEAAAAVLLWLSRTRQQKHKFVRMKLLSPVLPRGFCFADYFAITRSGLALRNWNACELRSIGESVSYRSGYRFQQLTYSEIRRMGLF